MTIGEHLEELRRRLLWGLVGFGVALALAWSSATKFSRCSAGRCRNAGGDGSESANPLRRAWRRISRLAAGEHHHRHRDRQPVDRLPALAVRGRGPLSERAEVHHAVLADEHRLLIGGMLFVYFLVLPWSIKFFLDFANDIPLPTKTVPTTQPHTPMVIPQLTAIRTRKFPTKCGSIPQPSSSNFSLKAQILAIRFSSQNLLVPDIKLSEYIDLVTGMLLTFGLSFQMPLVVLALVRIGIVEVDQLKSMRRYVYFAIAVLASVITPGDVITATILLMVPLALLYELGIWLARTQNRRESVAMAIEGYALDGLVVGDAA